MNLLPLLSLVLDHLLTTVLRQGLELPPSAASDVFEIWPLLGAVDTVPYVCE